MVAIPGKLGILLPLTSRGSTAAAVVDAVEANTLASLQPQQRCQLFIGIDFDDDGLLAELDSLQQRCRQNGISASIAVFPAAELQTARQRAAQQRFPVETPLFDGTPAGVFPPSEDQAPPAAPICWMWERLAAGCSCMLLLGDDTIVQPAGAWVDVVLGASACAAIYKVINSAAAHACAYCADDWHLNFIC